MTPKITGEIEAEFPSLTPVQQRDVVAKLQRYVDRGEWAQALLVRLEPRIGVTVETETGEPHA
jgi:hypothetical protein